VETSSPDAKAVAGEKRRRRRRVEDFMTRSPIRMDVRNS
jgi:hypothetical protein